MHIAWRVANSVARQKTAAAQEEAPSYGRAKTKGNIPLTENGVGLSGLQAILPLSVYRATLPKYSTVVLMSAKFQFTMNPKNAQISDPPPGGPPARTAQRRPPIGV